jgi:hypothetical protein
VSADQVGAGVERQMRELLLIRLRNVLIPRGARSRRRWVSWKLCGRRAVAIVVRDDDDVDRRTQAALNRSFARLDVAPTRRYRLPANPE